MIEYVVMGDVVRLIGIGSLSLISAAGPAAILVMPFGYCKLSRVSMIICGQRIVVLRQKEGDSF